MSQESLHVLLYVTCSNKCFNICLLVSNKSWHVSCAAFQWTLNSLTSNGVNRCPSSAVSNGCYVPNSLSHHRLLSYCQSQQFPVWRPLQSWISKFCILVNCLPLESEPAAAGTPKFIRLGQCFTEIWWYNYSFQNVKSTLLWCCNIASGYGFSQAFVINVSFNSIPDFRSTWNNMIHPSGMVLSNYAHCWVRRALPCVGLGALWNKPTSFPGWMP